MKTQDFNPLKKNIEAGTVTVGYRIGHASRKITSIMIGDKLFNTSQFSDKQFDYLLARATQIN